MNNTTPIKILTAAVLLTFGFALTANAALINKGVTEMNHEYTVSDTLSARQQAIPLIAASMASSQMDKLNAALNQGLDAGLTINEAKEILIQLYAYTGFPRSLNVGVWPDYFKGVQFSHDKEALNQYFRQMTPNTGPFDVNVISDAMSAVVDKSGPAILFTHSQGGGPGWYTAMKNNKVKAIVAFEPGSGFVFPEKELPAPMPSAFDTLKGEPVPMEQFMALTKIPILIIYGDNIPDKPVAMPAQDSWRVRLAMARKWRDVVNKHGGDVTVTHLPEVGIKGNTHFPFTDLNNVQIADLVSRFLKEKNLQ